MRRTKANYSKYLKAYLGINPESGEFGIAENQWNTLGMYYQDFLKHLEALKAKKSPTKGKTMTKKVKSTPSTKNTLKKSTAKKSTVKMFVNDYEIPMLEIQGKPRNTYISVKKACAILATNDNAELIEPINQYGRDLFKISYGDGGSFKVGQGKMNAVLDNAAAIEKAVS